jgi:hypothetical protein
LDIIADGIAAVLICQAWVLWHRRITWQCYQHRILTLSVTFQGVGMLLAIPSGAGELGDKVLHALTGYWELGDLIGDCLFIGAAAAFGYTALSRALPPHKLAWQSPLLLRIPAAIGSVALIAIYVAAGIGVQPHDAASLESPHPSTAVIVYWWVFSVTKLYLVVGAAVTFWLLRRTPRHRRMANLYLLVCCAGIGVPVTHIIAGENSTCYVFACMWAVGLGLTAAYSWRRKTRPFHRLMQAVKV